MSSEAHLRNNSSFARCRLLNVDSYLFVYPLTRKRNKLLWIVRVYKPKISNENNRKNTQITNVKKLVAKTEPNALRIKLNEFLRRRKKNRTNTKEFENLCFFVIWKTLHNFSRIPNLIFQHENIVNYSTYFIWQGFSMFRNNVTDIKWWRLLHRIRQSWKFTC